MTVKITVLVDLNCRNICQKMYLSTNNRLDYNPSIRRCTSTKCLLMQLITIRLPSYRSACSASLAINTFSSLPSILLQLKRSSQPQKCKMPVILALTKGVNHTSDQSLSSFRGLYHSPLQGCSKECSGSNSTTSVFLTVKVLCFFFLKFLFLVFDCYQIRHLLHSQQENRLMTMNEKCSSL